MENKGKQKSKKGFDFKRLLIDIVYDIIGSIFYGIGIVAFSETGGFAPAGASGLGVIVHHFIDWVPVGTFAMLMNIPIIIGTYSSLGKSFLLRSIKSIAISTLFIDVLVPMIIPVYQTGYLPTMDNPGTVLAARFIAALCSGVFCGVGLSMFYLRDSSTGGTDFIIMAFNKRKPHLSIGNMTLIIDGIAILLGYFAWDINSVILGIILTVVSSIVIDKITLGTGAGKVAMIVTDDGYEVAKKISEKVGRGSTLIKAIGPYSGQEKHVILSACSNSQITRVRRAAKEVDDKSMIIIANTSEVFGEGFKKEEEN